MVQTITDTTELVCVVEGDCLTPLYRQGEEVLMRKIEYSELLGLERGEPICLFFKDDGFMPQFKIFHSLYRGANNKLAIHVQAIHPTKKSRFFYLEVIDSFYVPKHQKISV